jgi:SAM-dependent methyltransferase
MSGLRQGYDERVGVGRAIPFRPLCDLDDDPAMMVQEQIARMQFFSKRVGLADQSILDLGCGTGFNCGYAKSKLGSGEILGVDISNNSVAYAKRIYSTGSFLQGDVCNQDLNCGLDRWDRVICCEVIEHVSQPEALLESIHRHLRPSGVAFISTPNRPVFSRNHEPSPVNRTHLKEYNETEFRTLLERHFGHVDIWGQRFLDDRLFRMQQAIVERNIKDYCLLGEWYWHTLVRFAWKTVRMEPLHRWLGGGLKYSHKDFSCVNPITNDSIWLCAIVTK